MNHWRNDAHELDARRRRMLSDGYRECDMPSCNCGSWHKSIPPMAARHFAIVQALVRHALYALADLPKDHPQRTPLRWQVQRLEEQLRGDGDDDRADKLGRLGKWFDDGAVVSNDVAVLSETTTQT